jgi:hypothetical protein
MNRMHHVLAHPLPHRAHLHRALALAGRDLMPWGPLRTPVVLAHLGDAFTMALALILWVLVVHASPPLAFGLDCDCRYRDRMEARSTRVYRKNRSVIYLAVFQPMFPSTRGHARFYCGLDTRLRRIVSCHVLLPPFSGVQVLCCPRNAESDPLGRPRSDPATRLDGLAGVLPSGEPHGPE